MAPSYSTVFTLINLLYSLRLSTQETVLGKENEDFDFDGLPGVQHEFKIDIPAGGEECFIQRVAEKASLHVSFEVLRGGDRLVNFYVKDPMLETIEFLPYKTDGNIDYRAPNNGNYMFCIVNVSTRFSSKLVYFYLITYVAEEWTKYVEEIEGLNTAVENFTSSISEVQKAIETVKLHQTHSRMNVIKDWFLVTGNNTYVMYWSLLQIGILMATSCFQVYFVRRLFRVSNVTPSLKPRA